MARKMIRKNFIFILLGLALLLGPVQAGSGKIAMNNGVNIKQDIDIYYIADLKAIGYDLDGSQYRQLNSSDKNKITTRLEAYFYKEDIAPLIRIEDATTTDNLYSPEKFGYYLFSFDKKNYDGKVLTSQSVLIYYDGGDQRINVKSALLDSESLKELEVVLEWDDNIVLEDRVWVQVYDEDGNLVDGIWLSEDNNWRHVFKGLDPLKHYVVWEYSAEHIFFTMERIGNKIILRNILPDEDLPDIIGPEDPDDGGILPDFIIWPDHLKPISPPKPDEDQLVEEDMDQEVPDSGEVPGQDQSQGDDLLDMDGHDTDTFRPRTDREGDKLPQTGLLWWPVPILFALAIFFFILSFRREDND